MTELTTATYIFHIYIQSEEYEAQLVHAHLSDPDHLEYTGPETNGVFVWLNHILNQFKDNSS